MTRCPHCGTETDRPDRAGWCPDCQQNLAHGRGEYRHLSNVRTRAQLRASLILDRCRFRQSLAEVVG